jgi:UDPglucose--hexose-1-phosphate uridylyltransferase
MRATRGSVLPYRFGRKACAPPLTESLQCGAVSGELRVDPVSGRQVVLAPGRARRPGVGVPEIEAATETELANCPFCEGREDRTPPETFALPGREPADSPGWQVRVVPNLYPAFEHQEVVIHSPRHVRSFADLEDREVERVAAAWFARMAEAVAEGFAYVHALVNEGRQAGASLMHSHSQLVWLREPPPGAAGERHGAVSELAETVAAELVVSRYDGAVALCPPASRVPYEVVIAADRRGGVLLGETALLALRDVVRRLRAVEGPVPWNAWLHLAHEAHVEVVPRLTIFAGIELGAGIFVNTLAPEDAAAALRGAA